MNWRVHFRNRHGLAVCQSVRVTLAGSVALAPGLICSDDPTHVDCERCRGIVNGWRPSQGVML